MTKELIEEARERATIGADVDPIDAARLLNELADALEATLGEPTDVREHLHAKCDCVPDLGPAHCHLCGSAKGSPVSWLECEAVAVPDATTVESFSEALIKALMAERDAAVAAIERVRAIHVRTAFDDSAFDGSPDDFYCKPCQTTAGIWPCLTIQALDGAPELDPYDDFCPTCDAPNPWHTETCAVPFRSVNSALDGAPETERLSIPIPNVPFGPEGVAPNIATASYLIEVVKKLDFGYANVGGSNVTATLRKILVDTAEALRSLPVEGESKP